MKKPSNKEETTVREKSAFVPPVLKRVGTLREMTRQFNGMGMDGPGGAGSFP